MIVEPRDLSAVAQELAAVGRRFYARGWVMGTSGNFSSVLSRQPLQLAMTASSVHKGDLQPNQILRVNERGGVSGVSAEGLVPSAECLLHLEIANSRRAGAVLHTHSTWSTILSDHFAPRGGVEIEGYEMLKGLPGNATHEVREFVPILDNLQDMSRLSQKLKDTLQAHPGAHAVLLKRHGLYTWGLSLADAERHVEILEFLFEVMGRTLTIRQQEREASYGALEHP